MAGTTTAAQAKSTERKQYVTFSIGSEKYGIDVIHAQEVLNLIQITHVPNTMSFMKGVIDLRGKIVPLIDMRIKFKLPEKEYDQNTVIIIIDVKDSLVGLIVDSVSDVITMTLETIQTTQHFSTEIDRDAVVGIGKHEGELVIILDVDRILSVEEFQQIKR